MKWALLFALGGTGAVLVGLCIAFLLLRSRVRRIHHVDPSSPTDAPLTWLVDPRLAARQHRRLAKVGRTAAAVADDHRPQARRFRKTGEPPRMVEVAAQLRARAVQLDRQLCRLHLLAPAARRAPLAELGAAIDELEAAAARLVGVSAQVLAPPDLAAEEAAVLDVAGQIERLADAHRALEELDGEAGLATRPVPAPPLEGRRSTG